MATYVLEYAYTDDYLERRGPFRDEHLALLRAAHERGEVIMAGVLDEPVDRALIVWRTDDRSLIEAYAQQDPYVRHGLVDSWSVRPWRVVIP